MAGFEDLQVWQRGVRLSADLYRGLAGCRDYAFRDQITSAGLSITSNIAEGMERGTLADQIRFLTNARGSCGEVRTQATVGRKAGLVDETSAEEWIQESRELSAMIQGLINSLGG